MNFTIRNIREGVDETQNTLEILFFLYLVFFFVLNYIRAYNWQLFSPGGYLPILGMVLTYFGMKMSWTILPFGSEVECGYAFWTEIERKKDKEVKKSCEAIYYFWYANGKVWKKQMYFIGQVWKYGLGFGDLGSTAKQKFNGVPLGLFFPVLFLL